MRGGEHEHGGPPCVRARRASTSQEARSAPWTSSRSRAAGPSRARAATAPAVSRNGRAAAGSSPAGARAPRTTHQAALWPRRSPGLGPSGRSSGRGSPWPDASSRARLPHQQDDADLPRRPPAAPRCAGPRSRRRGPPGAGRRCRTTRHDPDLRGRPGRARRDRAPALGPAPIYRSVRLASRSSARAACACPAWGAPHGPQAAARSSRVRASSNSAPIAAYCPAAETQVSHRAAVVHLDARHAAERALRRGHAPGEADQHAPPRARPPPPPAPRRRARRPAGPRPATPEPALHPQVLDGPSARARARGGPPRRRGRRPPCARSPRTPGSRPSSRGRATAGGFAGTHRARSPRRRGPPGTSLGSRWRSSECAGRRSRPRWPSRAGLLDRPADPAGAEETVGDVATAVALPPGLACRFQQRVRATAVLHAVGEPSRPPALAGQDIQGLPERRPVSAALGGGGGPRAAASAPREGSPRWLNVCPSHIRCSDAHPVVAQPRHAGPLIPSAGRGSPRAAEEVEGVHEPNVKSTV